MKKTLFFLLIAYSISFVACNKNNNMEYENGGVVLNFDDHYVQEWIRADSLLKKYNWKATFNVTMINKLDAQQIEWLQYLELQGHEIAGHGLNHKEAVEYISKYGMDKYLNDEVDSMTYLMNQKFNKITSFTYPGGSRNKEIDSKLFERFSILRATIYGAEEPNKQRCFFNGSHLVFALGIDENYEHYSKEYLEELLKYTRDNDYILILYAHHITESVDGIYQMKLSTLDYICDYAKSNNIKFMTLSDLADL